MSQPVRILPVSLADLREGAVYRTLQDPHALAQMNPPKRDAFLDNPISLPNTDTVQLLAIEGDTVIGRLDILAGEAILPSTPGQPATKAPIAWGSDWTVPEEHRGKLVGVSLMLRMHGLSPPGGAVGAHGPSVLAVPVYQKLKWVDIPIPRLILLRNSRSIVRRYLGDGLKGALPRAVADAGLLGHRLLLGAYASLRTRGLTAREAPLMPPSLDPLLAIPSQTRASMHRSAAFLNWQLRHRFFHEPERVARSRNTLLLIEDSRRDPIGYLMTKVRFHPFATHRRLPDLLLGSIQDWMIFPGREAAASELDLVLLAARSLARQGVDAIEICATAPLAPRLKSLGFLQVGSFHSMFRPTPGSPLADPRFATAEGWTLRPSDGDNFVI